MNSEVIPHELLLSDLVKYVVIPYFDETDLKLILEFKSVDQIREAKALGIDLHLYDEYALLTASQEGKFEIARPKFEC
jgi:hypothetical protein